MFLAIDPICTDDCDGFGSTFRFLSNFMHFAIKEDKLIPSFIVTKLILTKLFNLVTSFGIRIYWMKKGYS